MGDQVTAKAVIPEGKHLFIQNCASLHGIVLHLLVDGKWVQLGGCGFEVMKFMTEKPTKVGVFASRIKFSAEATPPGLEVERLGRLLMIEAVYEPPKQK